MDSLDAFRLALGTLRSNPLRTVLSSLGIGIGVAAVILLTSIGTGVHRYVLDEFTQFGTNILQVNPGSSETVGIPGVLGGSTRQLTIEDAQAVARLPGIRHAMPLVFGQARVEAGERGRSVYVYGGTAELPEIWRFGVRQGSFLPDGDPTRGALVAVLGPTLKREVFGDENALGRFVRIGGTRFRVIGIMESKGRMLGFDMDDAAYVPAATALQMFNLEQVWEIEVVYDEGRSEDRVAEEIRALLTDRHGGNEDFTITTQTAMLDVLDSVMGAITFAVGAIGGISLFVGAIGILTMMWITVGERVAEIGLVRALGATRRQVLVTFLAESAVLAAVGGVGGLVGGLGVAHLLGAALPGLPVETPVLYAAAGFAISVGTGLLSGLAPARRAAALDPIEALAGE